MKKLIAIIIILLICAFGIFWGNKKGELVEIEAVGSVMCLSCMGLQ
ncbi:MAG: hypothetical protein KGZ86_08420 [Candidatus Latescibacteria bacterium]|nr:hypothetical protein [Candidatus Latescibacterota bacterium]